MDELIRDLQLHNLRVERKKTKLLIRLNGLANPIYISKDIPTNTYILNTNDWISVLSSSALMFGGIVSSQSESLSGALMVAMAMFGYISVILTELKSKAVRDVLYKYNHQGASQSD